jgi:Protein of unknown function (DUF3592)
MFQSRRVPLALKINILLGSVTALIGWIFVSIGMIFVLVFGSMIDFEEYFYLNYNTLTVSGKVLNVEATSMEVNDRDVYSIEYEFYAPDGRKYGGTSYTTYQIPNPGTEVDIEYANQKPHISRIKGLTRSAMPIWVLFVAIFPLIGFALAIPSLISGWKSIRLLQYGQLTFGKLLRTEPTNVLINDQPVIKYIFQYQNDLGQTFETSARTHEGYLLQDDTQEKLFYNPSRPEQASLVDHLPGRPQVDDEGNISSMSFLSSIPYLIAPGIALFEIVLMILIF